MTPETEEERDSNIHLGVRQSIEELTRGRIQKIPREEGADETRREEETEEAGAYRPGMDATEARERGVPEREFVSGEIRHHMRGHHMEQDRAVAAALDEARRGGYDVPEKPEDERERRERASRSE